MTSPHSTELPERGSPSRVPDDDDRAFEPTSVRCGRVINDYLSDLLLPAWNELRAAYGIEPEPPRPGPPITPEQAKAAADEYWALEALRKEQAETELAEWKAVMQVPLVPVSDGIKSIYVNWQGPPISDDVSCSSGGPVTKSVLTGRNESISAIARAEIGNPDFAVKFSPMPKGEARLEVTRATPAKRLIVTSARGERGTASDAAAILGIKQRKLQAMSARGEIPGAAKLGRQWTYDLAKLRRFVQQQEKEWQGCARPRPGATGAGIPSGAALGSVGGSSVGRLRQMIRQSQKRVGKQAKRER